MRNPYKEARLDAGLSQQALGDIVGVTRLAIIRNEQALYTKPLPAVRVWTNNEGLEPDCEAGYYSFQHYVRGRWHWQEVRNLGGAGHPLSELFGHPNAPVGVGDAIKLCVHPVSLTQYYDGRQSIMPDQLREALLDAGMSTSEVEWLQVLVDEWRLEFGGG